MRELLGVTALFALLLTLLRWWFSTQAPEVRGYLLQAVVAWLLGFTVVFLPILFLRYRAESKAGSRKVVISYGPFSDGPFSEWLSSLLFVAVGLGVGMIGCWKLVNLDVIPQRSWEFYFFQSGSIFVWPLLLAWWNRGYRNLELCENGIILIFWFMPWKKSLISFTDSTNCRLRIKKRISLLFWGIKLTVPPDQRQLVSEILAQQASFKTKIEK